MPYRGVEEVTEGMRKRVEQLFGNPRPINIVRIAYSHTRDNRLSATSAQTGYKRLDICHVSIVIGGD